MKQNFLLIVILLWTTTSTTSETEVVEKYVYSQDHVNLASEIIDKLESNHLVKKDYRAVKSDSFEIFIDRLDPNKNIFTTSEVAAVFKDINANSTISDDLERAFFLFNNYVKRYRHRYQTQVNFLDDIDENNLNWGTTYYWRLRANFPDYSSEWLPPFSFTTSEALSSSSIDYINPSQYQEGVTVFGAFFNYFSAAIDHTGKEIWNSGPNSFVYYS